MYAIVIVSNRITTKMTGPRWSSYRTVSLRRIWMVRFLYMNRAYPMNASATGAMMAPDIFPARHLESSVLHDVVMLEPNPGAKLLPLKSDKARNMTKTDMLIH